jgi:signal peptidase II
MSLSKMGCLALIFAGGVGNIIDRIFFDRHVSDFMNIGILRVRTAIFNFADVYITIGVIAFLLLYRDQPSENATA